MPPIRTGVVAGRRTPWRELDARFDDAKLTAEARAPGNESWNVDAELRVVFADAQSGCKAGKPELPKQGDE